MGDAQGSGQPGADRRAVRSFLFGTVLGGALAVAGTRARRPRERPRPVAGLEAFEGAPCWEHDRARGSGTGSTRSQ